MKRLSRIYLFQLTFTLAIVGFASTFVMAKTNNPEQLKTNGIDSLMKLDTAKVMPDEVVDFIIDERLDSMAGSWFVENAFEPAPSSVSLNQGETIDQYSTKDIPDSVFMARLKALNSFIDLPYNPTVRNTIAFYAERRREKIEIMLGLTECYFPMIEEILDKYNLPLELKYMAVIESALDPRASSRAGAKGLWQFIHGTGKLYKMEISSYVDERFDPVKSTEAAAKYLSDLYKIYGDWHLVIAAYNCGPGNVNKAIKRSGNKKDYWDIYYRLPRETRGYVPGFIAASYICHYYSLHNYHPRKPNFALSTDTIHVSSYLNFKQIADQLGVDINMLRTINPMYKRDIIPASATKQYPLVLPTELIAKFIDTEQEILAHKREQYFPDNQIKNPTELKSTSSKTKAATTPPADVSGKDQVFYTVKSGDNVGFIASWFDVKISDIKYWNNLMSNLINAGQQLSLYVPAGKGEHYSKLNTLSFDEKQQQIGATITTSATKATPGIKTEIKEPVTNATVEPTTTSTPTTTTGQYHYYTVKSGDNLWVIAKKYPGSSAEDIRKLNGITNTRGLTIGQQIKIMK